MRAENPFHEDLFKQLRDLFPTAAVPRRLPAIPRRQLERGDDAFEQRRVSALPALRILNQAVPVLMRWRGTRSALSGLRLRDDEGFRPLTPDGRKLFSMACGRGEFAGAANASLVEIMAATVAAACVEVQVQPKLRTAVRLLEHPNLGVFKTGEGVSVGRYMYGLGMVGSRIMTTLVMQAFNFTPGSPTRSIEVARRSEPLVLLGAAMAAQAGNSLFGITSGSPGVLSERGFLDEEKFVEWWFTPLSQLNKFK